MPVCLVVSVLGAIAHVALGIALTQGEAVAALVLYLAGVCAASASLLILQRQQVGAPLQHPLTFYPVLFPFYDLLREFTVVRGSVALFAKPRTWRVTPRRT